jgi:hypothetical protein
MPLDYTGKFRQIEMRKTGKRDLGARQRLETVRVISRQDFLPAVVNEGASWSGRTEP